MKAVIARWMGLGAALGMCGALAGTLQASQEAEQAAVPGAATYRVSELATLGGSPSRGNSINELGWVTGFSSQELNVARHAMLWAYGQKLDLGTLGGYNSSVTWPVKNNLGLIVGISQTETPDPLGEEWSCSGFFAGPHATGQTCRGFAWAWGVMKRMPTLPGGNNSFATGANNLGQVVGWAENGVHDPTCAGAQKLQFRAVVWDPLRNRLQELPRYMDDSSSSATAINDRGQVVGISGDCDQAVGRLTAKHIVLWERGTVTNLGTLGGRAWNTAMAINRQGDVVGFAGEAGDDPYNPAPRFNAWLWTRRGGITLLNRLPGHVTAQANSINSRGQIVGTSCPAAGACSAVLWQGSDVAIDLTAQTPDVAGALEHAQDINEFGQITGRMSKPGTTQKVPYVLTPVSR